jgi:hypothetical protein
MTSHAVIVITTLSAPPIAGWVLEASGYDVVFIITAATLFIGAIGYLLLPYCKRSILYSFFLLLQTLNLCGKAFMANHFSGTNSNYLGILVLIIEIVMSINSNY